MPASVAGDPDPGTDEQAVLEGWISILAAINSDARPIERIYIQKEVRSRRLGLIERLARQRGIPVSRMDAMAIDRLSQGSSHGGALAQVGPRRYQELDTLGSGAATPFIVMLDGVEDPYNFGQAVRALYAAGAHGLVLRTRNWTSAAGVVARASAGASELMSIAVVDEPEEAVEHFGRRGLLFACTSSRREATPVYRADLTVPLFLVIGGERRGIRRSLMDRAELQLRIPYQADFRHSLGAAPSAAVLAFEVMRQREHGGR